MFSDKSKILLCIVSFESGILLIYFSAVSPNMDFTIFLQAGRINDSARVGIWISLLLFQLPQLKRVEPVQTRSLFSEKHCVALIAVATVIENN